MMQFLSPWMLFGLGALAAPILIHLWQRRRVIQIPFSTLRFLKIIAAKTSRISRLENWLLLLLRCLLFALLLLAASRPVLKLHTSSIFGGEVPRTVVLVIDNSASMSCMVSGQSRLDAAKSCAMAFFEGLRPGVRVAVIAAGERAELLVPEPTVERSVTRGAIESIKPTYDKGDFAVALREAAKIASRTERGIRQIFFFTDSQETNWQTTLVRPEAVIDDTWKEAEPQLVIVRPDDNTPPNASIKKVDVQTPFLMPGATLYGVATMDNDSPIALEDLLTLNLNGERVGQFPVTVAPKMAAEMLFTFQVPPVTGRWARLEINISNDNLPSDNVYYDALPVYQPPRVVLVENSSATAERDRPAFFLRKALGAGENGLSQIRDVPASALEDTPLEGETVLFLVDPGRLSDRSVARIERFLEAGGLVVFFPGNQTQLSDFDNLGFLPGKPVSMRSLPPGRQSAGIIPHPLFADTWGPSDPFPPLPQQRLLEWKPEETDQTLMTLGSARDRMPFLLTAERGAGVVFFVNAAADRGWGDFPLSPAFVPLVQQLARFSTIQNARNRQLTIGDPITLPSILPRDKPVIIVTPDGETLTKVLPAGADNKTVLIERVSQIGFYQVSSDEEVVLFAVNLDRAESVLAPIETAKLAESIPHTAIVGQEAFMTWLKEHTGMIPAWPLLLLLAAIVFLAEAMLSNLTARRRAQGDEHHIGTGHLSRRRRGVPFREGSAT